MTIENEPRSKFSPIQPESSPTAREKAKRLLEIEYKSGELFEEDPRMLWDIDDFPLAAESDLATDEEI